MAYQNSRIKSAATYIVLLAYGFIILFPMYITIVTSFKSSQETAKSFLAPPSVFSLTNFQQVIAKSNFFTTIGNSFLITILVTVSAVILNSMVSYFIVRNEKKKFYKLIYYYFIIAIFIPFQMLMLPLVKVGSFFNMLNIPGLIILYITFSFSTNVFLYSGYIKTIPVELEESAYIDGCSRLGIFFRVVFPLLKPITATVVILTALWTWNDFLMPLLILNRDMDSWTLPLFQFNFQSKYLTDYNLAFASYLMAMIPPITVYIFCQKYIIKGLTSGAVKG